MNRAEFHKAFKSPGPVVLPVIHVLDAAQINRNIETLASEGAAGVFLINHDFDIGEFLPILRVVREAWPPLWMGCNFLAVTGAEAFPRLGALASEGAALDAYWADDARIDERDATQPEATEIAAIRRRSGWGGMYFGGTAFKKQRPVDPADYEISARYAADHMDVVTTSGVATGEKADLSKIEAFRRGLGDRPLALASGVTPDNAADFADVDAFLVATGINHSGDFYNIDPSRLRDLMAVTRALGARGKHDK